MNRIGPIGQIRRIRQLKIVILTFPILLVLAVLFVQFLTRQQTPNSPTVLSDHDVSVSATIGTTQSYSLFGYTSARATVSLNGIGLLKEVKADEKGKFIFENFLAPSSIQEFCLTAIDTENRMSTPLCVPAPQKYTSHDALGPYLLPPSIEVSNGQALTGEHITITGKTIPGTDVSIALFHETNQTVAFVKSVYAAQALEKKTVSASSDGSYTAQVTSTNQETIRLFAQAQFNKQKTPKSNTLSIKLISVIMNYFERFLSYLRLLLNPNVILLLEVCLVLFLIYSRFRWGTFFHKKKSYAIIEVKNQLPLRLNYTALPPSVFE
ncbi:MAG: hypothetical protein NUV65_06055 [Candidatus Roizmanbacteria bacterium]|nr:hypothetical protein [Candidatus Roizmanbacteria bacterium]